MPEAHDAAWFAERLPPDDELDELLSDDPTAALIGVARDRAPVETGVVQPPDLDEDPEARRLFELAAAAARKLRASVMMTHPNLDMAFLSVEGVQVSDQLVLPLASAPSGEAIDLDYYVAGYPAVLDRQVAHLHPVLVDLLFGGSDEIVHKRVSPGGLIGLASSEAEHDASTLGGSSGSPVIDLTTHRVVGLGLLPWVFYAGHGIHKPGGGFDAYPVLVPADVKDLQDHLWDNTLALSKYVPTMPIRRSSRRSRAHRSLGERAWRPSAVRRAPMRPAAGSWPAAPIH